MKKWDFAVWHCFNSVLHYNKRAPGFFGLKFIFMTLHHSLMWEMSVGTWWCSCGWDEIVLGRCLCSGWASDSPWSLAVLATLPHMDFPSSFRAAKLFWKLPPAHWTARKQRGCLMEEAWTQRNRRGAGGTLAQEGHQVWKCGVKGINVDLMTI